MDDTLELTMTSQPNTTPIKDIEENYEILHKLLTDFRIDLDHKKPAEAYNKTTQAIQAYIDNKIVEFLEKAHRANNAHDYDNETDEYIDELIDTLKSNQSKG